MTMINNERHGDIALVTLRHGKANALDLELCDALRLALRDIEESDARAVVLTGAGTIFSAGVDLIRLVDAGDAWVARFVEALADAFEALFVFPKPVVAAVNGHAIAGGCILACACDYRVMARGPWRIGIPELRVGVAFPAIAIEIMRATLAPAQLRRLVLHGAALEGDEALAYSLVDELAEADRLLDQALEAADRLGRLRSEAFRLTKAQLREPFAAQARESPYEASVRALWQVPATLDAVRDYIARTFRPPAR
jgi:enoyl-CoA hydratase